MGYAIPTELFSPFVSSAVDVVRSMTSDENAETGFRWSLTLVAKILVRTILEGLGPSAYHDDHLYELELC